MVHFLKTSCKRVALLTLSCVLLSIGLLVLPQRTPIAHAANGFDMYVWTSLNQVWGHNGSDPGVLIDDSFVSGSHEDLNFTFGPITSVIARGSDVWEQRGRFLFQLEINGGWCNGILLETGTCMQELDDNPATTLVVAGGNGQLYQLHSTGSLWQYNGGGFHSWTAIDWNSQNVVMVANANKLFLYRSDGTVWKYLGSPLNWLEIDARSPGLLTGLTLSGDGTLFEMEQQFDSLGNQTNGAVWVGLGPFNWQLIDLGHLTDDILASNTRVYQLREDRSLLIFDGSFGWIQIDSGISGPIATGTHSDAIYKQLADNSIWEKSPQDSQYTLVSPAVSGQFVEMSSSTNG